VHRYAQLLSLPQLIQIPLFNERDDALNPLCQGEQLAVPAFVSDELGAEQSQPRISLIRSTGKRRK
jgi:hypothetical protein